MPEEVQLLVEDETDLLLFPLLRAGWAKRGEALEVLLSGWNDRRVIFGALNLRTGHRLLDVSTRHRLDEFHAFLDAVREAYRRWPVAMLLDEHSSHIHPTSQSLAEDLDIELLYLPKRSPKLNPLDTLWGQAKDTLCANWQYAAIDDQVQRFLTHLLTLSPAKALETAGVLSENFWLKSILCK